MNPELILTASKRIFSSKPGRVCMAFTKDHMEDTLKNLSVWKYYQEVLGALKTKDVFEYSVNDNVKAVFQREKPLGFFKRIAETARFAMTKWMGWFKAPKIDLSKVDFANLKLPDLKTAFEQLKEQCAVTWTTVLRNLSDSMNPTGLKEGVADKLKAAVKGAGEHNFFSDTDFHGFLKGEKALTDLREPIKPFGEFMGKTVAYLKNDDARVAIQTKLADDHPLKEILDVPIADIVNEQDYLKEFTERMMDTLLNDNLSPELKTMMNDLFKA